MSSENISGSTSSSSMTERYRLDCELGRGAMGTVYKAYDQVLKRYVALKILHPILGSDNNVIQRLKREVRLASLVSHGNVLRTYDFGELRGAKYISMAFVDGCDCPL